MEPKIKVIGRTTVDIPAMEQFITEHRTSWRRDAEATPAEALVEFAGRVCYMSFGTRQSPKSNGAYIQNLIRQGHESVLEHVSWTFVLWGVSRAFSHQFVRHRVGFAFSQLSQQYVDQEQIEFIEPFDLSKYPEVAEQWHRTVELIRQTYKYIRDAMQGQGAKNVFGSNKEFSRFVRSAARSILPNAIETKIVFTANARAIRHFLELRGGIEGDLEMRNVATKLLHLLQQEAPALFADFKVEYLSDSSPIVRHIEVPSSTESVMHGIGGRFK